MASSLQLTIAKGVRLSGIYEVDEPLASGGMGEIYRGHEIRTGAPVAIKLIHSELADDEDALDLFWREAKALQSIHHEAIVRYFVGAEDPTLGRPYLAMEFIFGETLKEVLRGGALALRDVMALKHCVASGLQAAHRAGVVHRDVTPDNIMVCERDFGRARVIDFGIAKSTKPGEHTVIGKGVAGKFSYMAPEQLGLFDGEVTARTDIYSLGLVLAFACRGKRIDMGGSQVEVIEKRRRVPDLSGIYPEIRPLIAWMLQPDPAKRPASMQEVADWAGVAPDGEDERTVIRPRGGPAPEKAPAPAPVPSTAAGRAPGKAASIAGALALILVGAGTYIVFTRSQAPVAEKPEQQVERRAPEPPPASSSARTESAKPSMAVRMWDFIAHYDIGGCALLTPAELSETSAKVEGFGLETAPFERFNGQFLKALGVDPDVDVRQVSAAQCSALDFVARLDSGAQPKLSLRAADIRSGDILSGDLSSESAHLELLVVDDDGKVYNATARIHPDNSFSMQIKKTTGGKAHPMLLIAVTSPAPLDVLRDAKASDGESFFLRVMQDVAGLSGVRANVAYFRVE